MDKGRIGAKTRLKEFAIDYIVIVVYLVLLFAATRTFYMITFGEIPVVSQWQSQLIATCRVDHSDRHHLFNFGLSGTVRYVRQAQGWAES